MDDINRMVLNIAGRRYRFAGALDEAVRVELGWTSTRYAQRLNRLLDEPEAALAEPVLIGRLRRLRDQRAWQRRAS